MHEVKIDNFDDLFEHFMKCVSDTSISLGKMSKEYMECMTKLQWIMVNMNQINVSMKELQSLHQNNKFENPLATFNEFQMISTMYNELVIQWDQVCRQMIDINPVTEEMLNNDEEDPSNPYKLRELPKELLEHIHLN